MKSKIFTLLFVVFAVFTVNTKLLAQASGDYVAIADGDYNAAATWGISDGAGNAPAANAVPTATINAWIPAGRSLTNNSAAALAKDLHVAGTLISGVSTTSTKDVTVNGNLYIESTGVLKSTSSNVGSVGTLKIGDALAAGPCTIQVDGQLGSASLTDVVGSGFRTYCQAGGTTTVQGSGKFNIARFQSGANSRSQTIVIDMDMNILNSANNGKTLSLENGAAGTAAKTLVINAGRTVRFIDNSVYALLGSQDNEAMLQTTGNLTYDIQGTLNTGSKGGIKLTTSNQAGSSTETVTLKIGSTGKLILGTKIVTKITQPTQSIVYDFADGSTVEFAGAIAAAFTSPGVGETQSYMTNFSNLILNSAEGLTLPTATTVRNNLTLTSGNLSLADNNLTVNGAIIGADATKHIATNGAGALVQNVAAETAVTFPIGTSAASFDPVTLKPSVVTGFSVKVGTALSGAASSGYVYNAKEWNIASTIPSSTTVTLTPSEVTASGVNHVIGQLAETIYTNAAATKTGNSYAATFSTFGSFVTGATDLGTGVGFVQNKLTISIFGNQLVLIGTITGQEILVYNAAGQLIKQTLATNDKTMMSLKAGLYFVKVNNQVKKVIL